ncbi:MAG: outer membrane protein assembly factor BamC [Enterobacteriaceae bacterium]
MSRLQHISCPVRVAGVAMALLLAACSSDPSYKRQISGSEDYLKTTTLAPLQAPQGMILPVQQADYAIPPVRESGATGKALDIRPPAQALALTSGSQAREEGDTITLSYNNSSISRLWGQITTIMQEKSLPVAERQDGQYSLTTGWVNWSRADENMPYEARYQLSLQQQGQVTLVKSQLLGLRQGSDEIKSPLEQKRYAAQLINLLSEQIDKQDSLASTSTDSELASLVVQSGSDDTGLPLLIVRTTYGTLWQRLPPALQRIGMEIDDSSKAQGTMEVKYSNPGDKLWQSLNVPAPTLDEGKYKLQLGDLDNRSSLQFINSKGQVLTLSQNDSLVKVVEAALNQTKGK